eukprot:TRINITY_DN7715_c0_g1_i1.p1 TRINITY_DN7715_c0_g1~~TRINITY_DN7715_c0_g1_i1.p1  ORF type:complete len:150 (-),score=32.53 TRINITY_DN7715_c0_g1_i1:228-677(-)
MEIPQKSAEFDYLFEFSPESPLHLGADQGQGAANLERKTVIRSVLSSDQPVRGATAKDQDYKESTKKKKFYAEMKTTNKLEKSRQSARECRARKKLRYQYLDDMIAEREKANDTLRDELVKYVGWCQMLDQNKVPEGLQEFLNSEEYQS